MDVERSPSSHDTDATRGVADSDLVTRLAAENVKLRQELEELRLIFKNTMEHGTFIENELEERVRETTLLSLTDPLTGIHNRLKFNESLNGEIQRRTVKGGAMPGLIMFDIDNFKAVNDTWGHHVGDVVLIELIKLVNRLVRKGDILARWGGEEFVLLTADLDLRGIQRIADRIRAEIEGHSFTKVGRLTCSFGVTQMRLSDSSEEIFRRVDDALYRAKQAGRNRVVGM
jgi:diguanylate cyclase (GGDEF)-like protein